jgi:hypothetical protein
MPVATDNPVPRVKVCAQCGVSVSGQRRFKDSEGNYFCEKCGAPAVVKETVVSAAGSAGQSADNLSSRLFGLVARITCPHCWYLFTPDKTLWVSQHSDLMGDPLLGPEKPRRFLPVRFTIDGRALDARGAVCQSLACPQCHLILPRSVLEADPLFLSIIGGPQTGKSYFLASMTWELRSKLPAAFAVAFSDADTVTNQQLNDYEATLFLPEDPDRLTAIAKTDTTGAGYDQTMIGGHEVILPKPFLFNIRPLPQHPHVAHSAKISRVLCMYDNAGESFQPGVDDAKSPVTQHLAKSKVLMFLFDPTQDPRFRQQCRAISKDPQLTASRNTQRQETILTEAAHRVRRYANLPPNKKHPSPLLVLVPKSDVWGSMLDEDLSSDPVVESAVAGKLAAVDIKRIERVSSKLRDLLLKFTPELIGAAEDFCEHVVYIPISALGCSPQTHPEGRPGLFVLPKDVRPRWASVPVMYMFAKWTTGLIAGNSPVQMQRGNGNASSNGSIAGHVR